ncbi:uncharacterized protein LOC127752374 isoform X2 [Frankliniella occidentalis]|uniref:Uncharacterized protein LOC127752374 isoform X2 n=1 Tax=Frankliniella occidentalis TaxID=133901 RepID=A0A9C6XC24_FRAOC|nr:uncharacterized protein LOC127752374 isoform X2 [Frankliniella occidentalis]
MIEHYIVIIPSNIMDLLPMGLPPGQPRWTTLGGSRGEPLSCRRRGGEPGVSFSSSSRISRTEKWDWRAEEYGRLRFYA